MRVRGCEKRGPVKVSLVTITWVAMRDGVEDSCEWGRGLLVGLLVGQGTNDMCVCADQGKVYRIYHHDHLSDKDGVEDNCEWGRGLLVGWLVGQGTNDMCVCADKGKVYRIYHHDHLSDKDRAEDNCEWGRGLLVCWSVRVQMTCVFAQIKERCIAYIITIT